jgi:hypothetical protein
MDFEFVKCFDGCVISYNCTVLQSKYELFGTLFFHFHVNDIRLWRITVYSLEKRRQHFQATSFMPDFDDVNFPITVANCVSPCESYLNGIGVV